MNIIYDVIDPVWNKAKGQGLPCPHRFRKIGHPVGQKECLLPTGWDGFTTRRGNMIIGDD